MEDIVERLRDRAYCTYRKDALCEEAANLIEKMRGTKDSEDVVAAARAHLDSLPPHLSDRYSANIIRLLIGRVMQLDNTQCRN